MARLPDLSMIRIADLCFRWYQRFNAEKGDGHLTLLYERGWGLILSTRKEKFGAFQIRSSLLLVVAEVNINKRYEAQRYVVCDPLSFLNHFACDGSPASVCLTRNILVRRQRILKYYVSVATHHTIPLKIETYFNLQNRSQVYTTKHN